MSIRSHTRTRWARTRSGAARARTAAGLLGLAGVLLLSGLSGCRGDREDAPPRQFFPDLDDQQKWKPQSENGEMFADGRSMRLPVPGTVPFGYSPATGDEAWAGHWNQTRSDLLANDEVARTGIIGASPEGAAQYAQRIPAAFTVDMNTLRRGQERFNIYCSACHGYAGDARGTVAAAGFNPIIPSFYDPTFADPANVRSKDGYIFHTIRNGKPVPNDPLKFTMPAYGHAVSVRDAWAIVAYVRALQGSREGTIEDVPEALRGSLNQTRAVPPAPLQDDTQRGATPQAPTSPSPSPAPGSGGGS